MEGSQRCTHLGFSYCDKILLHQSLAATQSSCCPGVLTPEQASSGQEALEEDTGMGLALFPVPPKALSPGQVCLVQAFLPAEFLSFQESGCTLTYLLPLEIRCQQGPCVCVSVGPRGVLLLAPHALCAFWSSSCIYPFALLIPHL